MLYDRKVTPLENPMKLTILSSILLSAFALTAADSSATFVPHDKVAAALAKGGPLVTASDLLVSGSHREKAGQVEIHDKETDVIYVTDGSATFVTGGTIVGDKVTRPGQHLGTDIK